MDYELVHGWSFAKLSDKRFDSEKQTDQAILSSINRKSCDCHSR